MHPPKYFLKILLIFASFVFSCFEMKVLKFVCGLLSCLLIAGCSFHKERPLRIGNGVEPSSLDPQVAPGLSEGRIVAGLFEGLFVASGKDLHPIPAVAESYQISDDRKEYTFYLREEARWSNGDPVVAKDFVHAIQRGLSVNLASPWAELYFVLKNAKRYYQSEVTDFSKVGIEAVSPKILKLTLERPVEYLPSLLSHWAWSPVHKRSIEAFGSLFDRNNRWTRPESIVTNGAYQLASVEVGNRVVLKKNSTYWNKTNVAIETIEFLSNIDAATEENMFQAGQLDITENVPSDKIDFYRANGALRSGTTLGSTFLWFNCKKAPFDNPRIRLAFSLAVDREAIGKLRNRGKGFEAFSLVPPGTMNYEFERHLFKSDLSLAKKILEEEGYSEGRDFPRVTLVYNSTAAWKTLSEAVQEMWRKNLGVSVELKSVEWGVFLDERRNHNFDICRGGWIGDYNDATTFLDLLKSDNRNNHAQWSDLLYDKRLAQANEDFEDRAILLFDAEKLIIEQMPIIPLYYDSICHLVSKQLKGWYPNILDWHDLKTLSFD